MTYLIITKKSDDNKINISTKTLHDDLISFMGEYYVKNDFIENIQISIDDKLYRVIPVYSDRESFKSKLELYASSNDRDDIKDYDELISFYEDKKEKNECDELKILQDKYDSLDMNMEEIQDFIEQLGDFNDIICDQFRGINFRILEENIEIMNAISEELGLETNIEDCVKSKSITLSKIELKKVKQHLHIYCEKLIKQMCEIMYIESELNECKNKQSNIPNLYITIDDVYENNPIFFGDDFYIYGDQDDERIINDELLESAFYKIIKFTRNSEDELFLDVEQKIDDGYRNHRINVIYVLDIENVEIENIEI